MTIAADECPTLPVLPERSYPFIQARNYTKASRTKIDLIVIHDAEYPERPGGARWVADFFAGNRGMTAPQASAHYSVDDKEIIQCVRDEDVAWHAPGANRNGIGIEHAGYAAQSREQWLDTYSMSELAISALLVADLCEKYEIPIAKLSADDLKAGKRGICGHVDVTNAFSAGKGHTDPGPNFPWPIYLSLVRQAAGVDPLDSIESERASCK